MSALQYLNKKSWHTATIKNNEKVWLKEQAAEKEKKRIEELQKELAEERRLQEIQRLEEQSGRIDPAELLKRRRLNWMYDHGPDKGGEKQKEKDREDVLLGRKEIDLEEVQEPAQQTSLAEEEAKMREDPLVRIELERARILKLAGRNPSRRADLEQEEKRKRKEERAKIREERRTRREKRALRRSGYAQALRPGNGRKENEKEGRGAKRETKRARASHERKMEELRETERKLLAEMRASPRRTDDDHTAGRKRPRKDTSSPGHERSRERSRLDSDCYHDGDRKYGLSIPENGSRVAVTHEFVPKSKRRRDERNYDGRETYHRGDRHRLSVSSTHRRRQDSQRVLNSEERERRLEEMRCDAEQVYAERRGRLKRYAKEEDEERRSQYRREDPTRSFARDCISAGLSAGSTAERIRQRRAWATRDGDAAY